MELLPYVVSTLGASSPSVLMTSLMLIRQVLDYVGEVVLLWVAATPPTPLALQRVVPRRRVSHAVV